MVNTLQLSTCYFFLEYSDFQKNQKNKRFPVKLHHVIQDKEHVREWCNCPLRQELIQKADPTTPQTDLLLRYIYLLYFPPEPPSYILQTGKLQYPHSPEPTTERIIPAEDEEYYKKKLLFCFDSVHINFYPFQLNRDIDAHSAQIDS